MIHFYDIVFTFVINKGKNKIVTKILSKIRNKKFHLNFKVASFCFIEHYSWIGES